MQTSDREVNDKSDDDDVIVVPTENNENPDIDYPTLKRIINISDAKDITVPSPSNNMDISSNSFNTSAMQTSDMEVDENSDDDDIIVVQTENNENQDIDYPTLKRIINSMVSHFIEENPGNEVTPHYIIQRLKALYHKDFSNRLQEIKYCIGRSNEQYISRKKMLREIRPGVRKSDIITLYSDNWLNDIIINQYMSILIQNNKNYGAISSFWLEELLRRVEPSLPHNWDKMKCILAPTCVEFHWSLLCYYPEKYNVVIYSSLSVCKTVLACASKLLNFFNNKQGKEGRCLIRKDLPRQENEHDCGVYVCMFARCVVFGNTFDIEPAQVCAFRKWLKNEIVQGKLFESKEEVTTEEYSDSESEDNDEE
uniref:sentrin-specific protease 1-like isoform X1 n=1 Tax=Styela clava TaxID=7725 RepID=UPI001939DAFA|nr:sentrin-specific protease 1-like isoform X1 [Styela clava]